ncbi:MAG: GNAT family N-acetyltransferase [Flavipsychrobacter sp.]|nr:GNAT family N-acetyltransferase [Flavipsychrobacter sp.]
MSLLTVLLSGSHKKESFSCGNILLDAYLHKQAKQDVKRKLAACFVLAEKTEIKGYYTLSGLSIDQNLLPAEMQKKLPPSYLKLPATLLGRLAVDSKHQGQGIGELLLIDALKRSYLASSEVASMAAVVDPIDADAFKFYQKYGFLELPESDKLFLPMGTIAQLF